MKVKVLNAQTQLEIREIDLPETVAQHGECLLGRSPNSALVLDSPDVSRLHGKFRLEQGQYYFYDLGSANGSTVNGQLAQANHGYALKSGDIIRIGEFVLLLHEISLEDLPATVIGDPNATVIGNFQPAEIAPPVQSPPLEVAKRENVPAIVDSIPEEISSEIAPEPSPILAKTPEKELAGDFVEPPQITTEPIKLPKQEEEPETPSTQVAQINEDELAAEPMPEAETSLTDTDSTTIQLSEPNELLTEAIDTEPALTDSTTIQLPDEPTENTISADASALIDSIPVELQTALDEPTEVAIVVEPPSELPSAESVETVEESLEGDPWDAPLSAAEPITEKAPEERTVLQISEPLEQPEGSFAEPVAEEPTVIQASEPEEVLEEKTVLQISEPLEQPESIEEVSEERTVLQISELLEQPENSFAEPIAEEPTVIQVSESLEQPISEIASPPEVKSEELALDEIKPALTVTADSSINQPATIAEPTASETPVTEKSPIVSTKYIALLANDSQIEELEQLVDRHQDLLRQCKTIATPTVGDALRHSLKLTVSQQTPAVSSGGYQTINSLITSDQVLAVIFLRDFLAPQPTQVNDDALSRSCNVYQVLFATNAPTADALLHYIHTVVATQ